MSSSPEFMDDPISTAEAVEKLRNFNEEDASSRVAQFAHFIAGRLNPELIPEGFVMASVLSIYDLQQGRDGYANKPIKNELVGLEDSDYDELLASVPRLAYAAFPESFANSVVRHVIKSGIMPAPEASVGPTLTKGEIITETIENIDDAERLIVHDARDRLASLSWQDFGVEKDAVEDYFTKFFVLSLRNAPYSLPLNLMIDDREHEAGLLQEMFPAQKKHLQGPYWLAMTCDSISPEHAMATRDHIFLKGLEMVAAASNIDPARAVMHFAKEVDGPINRAGTRLQVFLNDHPEFADQ
jgi:hypothetical protein